MGYEHVIRYLDDVSGCGRRVVAKKSDININRGVTSKVEGIRDKEYDNNYRGLDLKSDILFVLTH